MVKIIVNLNNVKRAISFCDACCSLSFDIDIFSGHNTVDAKSIMGLFALDLSKDLTVVANIDKNSKDEDLFTEKMKPYIV